MAKAVRRNDGRHAALVAMAVAVLAIAANRVTELVAAFVHFLRSDDTASFWCAATSWTDGVGFDGHCAPEVPVKWEELGGSTSLALAAALFVLLVWVATSAPAATPTCSATTSVAGAAPSLSRVLAVHGTWLALHSWLDEAYADYFVPRWLCTWSWRGTAVYAALRLVEGVRHAGGFGRSPALPVVFAGMASLLYWTNFAFFGVSQNDVVGMVLHAISLVYVALALALDERHRPRYRSRAASCVAGLVAAALPPLVIDMYGVVYDYRDLYAAFVVHANITQLYSTFIMTGTACTACTLCVLTYGVHPPRPAGRAGRRGAQVALLVVLAATPGALILANPERRYHERNCPGAPVPLAAYNASTAQFDVDAGAWAALAGDLRAPVYVHAIVSADPAALAVELGYLEQHLLRHDLRGSCVGKLALPARYGAGAGTTLWAWAIALRRVASDFHLGIISPHWWEQHPGTLLILLAELDDDNGAATAAAVVAAAYAPSVTLHLPQLPEDRAAATRLLEFLERAAAVAAARQPILCRLRAPLAAPLAIDSDAAVVLAGHDEPSPTQRLGHVALVATETSDHAPATALQDLLAQHPNDGQRWQGMGAPIGAFALGVDRMDLSRGVFRTADTFLPWTQQHFAGRLAPASSLWDADAWLQPDEVREDLVCFLRQST